MIHFLSNWSLIRVTCQFFGWVCFKSSPRFFFDPNLEYVEADSTNLWCLFFVAPCPMGVLVGTTVSNRAPRSWEKKNSLPSLDLCDLGRVGRMVDPTWELWIPMDELLRIFGKLKNKRCCSDDPFGWLDFSWIMFFMNPLVDDQMIEIRLDWFFMNLFWSLVIFPRSTSKQFWVEPASPPPMRHRMCCLKCLGFPYIEPKMFPKNAKNYALLKKIIQKPVVLRQKTSWKPKWLKMALPHVSNVSDPSDHQVGRRKSDPSDAAAAGLAAALCVQSQRWPSAAWDARDRTDPAQCWGAARGGETT